MATDDSTSRLLDMILAHLEALRQQLDALRLRVERVNDRAAKLADIERMEASIQAIVVDLHAHKTEHVDLVGKVPTLISTAKLAGSTAHKLAWAIGVATAVAGLITWAIPLLLKTT